MPSAIIPPSVPIDWRIISGTYSPWTSASIRPPRRPWPRRFAPPTARGFPSPTRATSLWRNESMASCIPRTKRCSGRPVPAGSIFDRWALRDETPMFLFAHLGIGLGLAWLLAWKSPARFDYRLVLFGSILPDLIDKPLGYALGLETRIWSHTFVFLFAILAASFAPNLWSLRFIGFGVATHLLVDRIWEMPWVVLYPAYGWGFHPASQDAEHWIATLLHDPLVQAGEIVGVAILVLFAWRKHLGSWRALREFVRHGTVPGGAPNRS